MLKAVVANQPQDQVAKRMLDALTAPRPTPTRPAPTAAAQPTDAAQPAPTTPPSPGRGPARADDAEPGPTTDLVGSWHADLDGNAFT